MPRTQVFDKRTTWVRKRIGNADQQQRGAHPGQRFAVSDWQWT
jgi:hypothetical protein